MAVAGRVALAGGVQPVDRVLPDRLQQPVPGFAVVLVDDHQGLVDQTAQGREHLGLRDRSRRAARAHGTGGVEREAPLERAETTEHRAVGLVEQVVAPVHRRGEGLLAAGGASGAAHQQREAVVEPGGDLRRGERAQPRGRELECEGDPVQAAAQRPDGLLVGGVEREPGPDAARPIDEQRHRLLLLKGRHSPHRLAGDAQRFPARGQHRDLGARAQHRVHQLGARLQQVLAVVEAHEDAAIPELQRQGPPWPTDRLDHDADGGGGQLRDQRRVGGGTEVDPPHPVRPVVGQLGGGLRRQGASCRHRPPR